MKISSVFNRFVFGVVLKQIKQSNQKLKFDELKISFNTTHLTHEELRNLFKYLDLNYPRNDRQIPISYTQLDSKQMTKHIEWLEMIAGTSGIELPYIAEEWERLMKDYKEYK